MKTLSFLVRAVAPSGAIRDVCQVSDLSTAKDRADVSAMREDTVRAYVLDLLSDRLSKPEVYSTR